MKKFLILFTFLTIIFNHTYAIAFKGNSWLGGLSYYSQNFLNEITLTDDASTSFLGEVSYPLTFRYETAIPSGWYLGTQLIYTILPRTNTGDTTKVTTTHLAFHFGNNFSGAFMSGWDWFVGPGILKYDISGPGGTKTLNNGTGTATFALPGRSSSVQKVSTNFGVSRLFDKSRIGVEIIFESFFSSDERTQNLMLSYTYLFTSGGGGGSSHGVKK